MVIRREKVDYFLFLVAFFISASANAITISNVTLIFAFFATLYIFLIRGYEFDKAFVYFIIAYLLLTVIYMLKFGHLNFRTFRELIRFIHAYLLIKMIWRSLIPYFTKTVYVLSLISLPMYFLQLYDYELTKSIVGIVENNIPFLDYREGWYENIMVFTTNDYGRFRNSGFAWEPKGFGTFLTLAMFFRLIENRFKLIDKYMITYLIAMITTFSTATLSVTFFAVFPFYIFNKPPVYKVVTAALIVPVMAIAFTKADFLEKKIIHEYKTKDKYVAFVQDDRTDMEDRSLGRFGSFVIDMMDLKKEPVLGYGSQMFERTQFSISGVRLTHVNGLSDFMAHYGIVGTLFLLITLSITFKQWSLIYKFKGWYWIVIEILATSFASAILFYPLYLMFMFFPFFKKGEEPSKLTFDYGNRMIRWN